MYLYNQTFYTSNNWKSLYKLFHTYVFDKKEIFRPKKPQLHYLRAYKYKVYMLIKSKNNL